ncbi:histone-lysine N-methyltransferase ATXR2 isoform X1 [Telopea speciosissima]|uniref:histone-lysine N-methyltransferase ATXR2 isoform X1 n=1 Tax=Telopea speciosissima TaxID=54955 RepID=UPI001CC80453|nr:histone-lysine N-methyltransferase ATXR2 isoform X1 [Telopea speciosissima]
MTSICTLDVEFADKIDTLLKPPSPHEVQDYFDKLIKTRQCRGISIKQDGEYGKGVYAEREFAEDNLVLKDQMVVGAQHSSNKVDCLVCSYCFRFIGSIELQIGRKLYLQDLGLSSSKDCVGMHQHTSKGFCLDDSLDEEENSLMMGHKKSESCSSSDQDDKIPLPKEVIAALMNGDLVLPHSNQFSLPSVVPCPGGCGEANYCSKLCAEADWELFHSLLCTGERSGSSCREALMKFVQHANETNDIFFPAAKAVSFTILNYKKLKAARLENQESYCHLNSSEDYGFSLLLEAWKPLSMGYKKKWWDCIALPDDVGSHDEASFRLQIRELAFTSLQLLKEAIFDKECAPLFSLEIYGHIIGMFELNNLDLVVASPVEDYFLYIDDLPHPEKEKAEQITRPFLDALGDDYSVCCQGTAFFPIQSCMNHSCCPNAKAFKREEDKDGQATIISLRPISRGEEITISYIDEDLPFEERQVLLADYGFRCRCPKCIEDQP